jgi:hypothetical protein
MGAHMTTPKPRCFPAPSRCCTRPSTPPVPPSCSLHLKIRLQSQPFFPLFCQATLHRVLRHLVMHRHRLAAIEDALARDRAAAAAAERKLGQALSVQPTIDMSYKQTTIQQHQLASTIDNFASQVHPCSVIHSVDYCCSAAGSTVRPPSPLCTAGGQGPRRSACGFRRSCAHRGKRPETRRTHRRTGWFGIGLHAKACGVKMFLVDCRCFSAVDGSVGACFCSQEKNC